MTDRYARQIVLPEVGAAGQARLAAATVLVVGAGGLGCPALQCLAAAGVGRIVILDPDRVEESNLHRQPLYRMGDLGLEKARAARAALRETNPHVRIDALVERLGPDNAGRLIRDADLAIDAADSLAATYMMSDECRRLGKPLVSASALGLSGYVGAFCGGAPSYRAVFPEMPRQAGSCAQAGVLGTVVATLGALEAHMALAWLLGLEPPVLGELVTVDLRTLRFAGFSFANAPEPPEPVLSFICASEVRREDVVVDLRSLEEAPVSPIEGALRIGVEPIEREQARFPSESRIVLCCRSGIRAWRAARALQRCGHTRLALIALGG